MLESDKTGKLMFLNPSTITLPDFIDSAIVDTTGKSLYVQSSWEGGTYQYAIRPDGALTPLTPPMVPNHGENDITLSPDNRTVYICGVDCLYQYHRAADGTLHPLTPPSVPTDLPGAISLTIDPSGRFAYALLLNHGEPVGYAAGIDEFRILPSGALREIPNDGSGLGVTMPKQIVAGPSGRYVYVASERLEGGDYTGTGLLLFRVGKGGALARVGRAGVGLNPIGDTYFDTVCRLLFLPSGRSAVAISDQGDGGREVLMTLRVGADGKLAETGIYVITESGNLAGISVTHPPHCADVSDMALDPVNHVLYLTNFFDAPNAKVYAYHYMEGKTLQLTGAVVSNIGGVPNRIVIARPHSTTVAMNHASVAARRTPPKYAGVRRLRHNL